MKSINIFIRCYLAFVLVCISQKILFLVYHWNLSVSENFIDCLKILWNGIAMDLSVAGYFTALPALLIWIAIPFNNRGKIFSRILQVYFALISFLVSLIFIADAELYTYWGFHLDSTIFNYIAHKDAFSSISATRIVFLILGIAIYAWLICLLLDHTVVSGFRKTQTANSRKKTQFLLFPILLGLLFILIRGGITTSTMNVGRVYFSKSMFLNHAAVNPCFNLFASMNKPRNFNEQYRFMDDRQAETICRPMLNQPATDTTLMVLNTDKPNIVIIILESFGKKVLENKEVTPELNHLADEGILFNNMYANSFRTDRGLVSILSAYPAQPTMSIIKYPEKAQHLESLPATLCESGYKKASFLYGGDVNFANIKTYLVSSGIVDITKDSDFPVTELLNKWGAPDHVAFNRFLKNIVHEKSEPYLKIFLTLSSHEPFDVPSHKFQDPYLNSIAYTDSCLGVFIDSLKQSKAWEDMLLVLIPDHDMKYPDHIQAFEPDRFDIFSIWTGGAVGKPMKTDLLCSQTDLAATLLGQLKIDHSKFIFSKDLFQPSYQPHAFYDFPDGFGLITNQGKVVFDCSSNTILIKEGASADSLLMQGKAYLQYLYDDIQKK